MAKKFKGRRGKGTARSRARAKAKAHKAKAKPKTKAKSKATPKKNAKATPKKKPGKKKDKQKDKDKRKHRDRAAAKRAATQAAAKGWSSAKAKTGRNALNKAAVEQTLTVAEGTRNGARVRVDANLQGKSWSVKATATKGGQRASASKGRGSVLKSKAGATFMASVDIRPVEKRVEKMTRRELGNTEGSEGNNIDAKLRQIEAKGQRMLDGRLKGIDLSVKKSGSGDQEKVQFLIQPNYYEWEVTEVGGSWPTLKKKIDARNGHRGRYNQELAFLQKLGSQFKATVTYKTISEAGDDFYKVVEVKFTSNEDSSKYLMVWMHRIDTGPGKHETTPGDCALTGNQLTAGKTRPHDAIAGSQWRRAIERTGRRILGRQHGVPAFLQTLGAAAESTGSTFMIGDGRSSRAHEYTNVTKGVQNQDIENVHGDTNVGERQRRAHDSTNDDPNQHGNMLVNISTKPGGSSMVSVPKTHYSGTDWAGLDKKDTNAAVRARIKIAIVGLQGVAQGLLPVAGLDESRLPAFWQALEAAVYRSGKW